MELAVSPDGRWETTTAPLLAAAADAGFAAVGIAGDRADAAAVEAYRAAGLRCHEVLALVVTEDEAATRASAERLAEAARVIGAEWVLTVFAAPLTAETARIISRSADVFMEGGAGMAVEFSPLGPIGTVQAGLEVTRIANGGTGRAGLMIDSWHFSFGKSTWEDLATVPVEEIAYVQFADALAPESERLGRETMHRRTVPGAGVLDVGRFASTLRGRGYDGTVSVEVLSAALRTLPIREILQRLYTSTAPYWV